ncbi:unnamed protein product [Rotaria socialis]|uniref:RHS repeat-associated core domain-containing protein n=1 Tax=Rotaria socialis TaxID=392032 RepID=A0A817SXI7_9BILA|nr:unnamed protein product [Rotaria socialis]CAF3478451.1 unnamed protein product [Rotaria socialis]CAF4439056.1 unnamed protein product [Rotaria socialis]CAF4502840.1 unnamed protein product [Rotaria socialis]
MGLANPPSHPITDRKTLTGNSFSPVTLTATDYYAFGAPIAERSFNASGYRYGFNGKEKVDEIYGSGNMIDLGARELDTRVGRTPTMDKKAQEYPNISPYSFVLNNPILLIDPDGKDVKLYHITGSNDNGKMVYTKDEVSQKTESVLRDIIKTHSGLNFLSQFAKKGQTIGGYTFKADGVNSKHDLNIYDYSYENETNTGTNTRGLFGATSEAKQNKIVFELSLFSRYADKEEVGETYTHETQLHGKKIVENVIKEYNTNGSIGAKKEIDRERDANPNGNKEHDALNNKNKNNVGVRNYNQQAKELINVDKKYEKTFKNAPKQ